MDSPSEQPVAAPESVDTEYADLLGAIARKQRAAIEALYGATAQRLYGLALRITQRRELAEEALNDVYLQVWRQAATYDPARGSVLAWLSVLCRSRALDALRRHRSGVPGESVGLDAVAETGGDQQAQDLLLSVERGSRVHAALAHLRGQQRQLLALAYFRGLTHSELAQVTGLPLGTVKTQIRRTLTELRQWMSDAGVASGESHE
ncbi:MAG: sigma-70 family RNA polymerase sigma factor [Pseudomonadota bacterium]|nr:sigma-70 family RNA polymerase sigma factor [Pseudomonadota bacterium]